MSNTHNTKDLSNQNIGHPETNRAPAISAGCIDSSSAPSRADKDGYTDYMPELATLADDGYGAAPHS